jgi:four helix bundle protein
MLKGINVGILREFGEEGEMDKFEKLEIWKLSLEHLGLIYDFIEELPKEEEYNLIAHLRRAAALVALNIAEGSTGQTDAEQARFLGDALRSLIETVACMRIGEGCGCFGDKTLLRSVDSRGEVFARKIHAMRKSIAPEKPWLREIEAPYEVSEGCRGELIAASSH